MVKIDYDPSQCRYSLELAIFIILKAYLPFYCRDSLVAIHWGGVWSRRLEAYTVALFFK